MDNKGILLESGTGELEILHFTVNGQHYAINVIKVRELLEINNLSKVPNSKPEVAGISLNRKEMITVIDLLYVIEKQNNPNVGNGMTLVCEFNKLKVAFSIEEVMGIHKIGWNKIMKPDTVSSNTLVIGNIDLNGVIVMLLDFEKIIMDINPLTGIHSGLVEEMDTSENQDLSKYKVFLADDSPMIRKILKDTLNIAGLTDLTFFDDGAAALEHLEDIANRTSNYREYVDLLITDIEMPRLDGHALTRRIKEHKILRTLPVVIFSSLITESLRHKGEDVGANAQLSKPDIGELINTVSSLLRESH